MKQINDKNKAVIDEYFSNGFRKRAAYETEYEVRGSKASRGYNNMMQRPQCIAYFEQCQSEIATTIGISKETVIMSLARDVENYEEFVTLGAEDNLTERQEKKFYRLAQIYNSNSKTKSLEVIAKLLGLFEPEKIEIKAVNYTVDFGK